MSDAQLLHEFLRYPRSCKRQDVFVRMCVRLTIGYLRYLSPKGRTLPLSQQVGGNPVHDLAIDIVGSFLATEHSEPCGKLFNYYRRRGITDFHKPDPTDLWNAFRPLLFHFIRQERSNLLDEEDPQKALLKRAFKDALMTDEYQRRPGQSGAVFVNAAKYDQARREECECNDLSPDGVIDWTAKFDKVAIIAALGEVSDGEVVTLTISGQLLDGTPFEGADCVVIRAGGMVMWPMTQSSTTTMPLWRV